MCYNLKEWVREWLMVYKKIMVKPSTFDSYLYDAKRIECTVLLNELTSMDIQSVVNELVIMGCQSSTIKHTLCLIRQSLVKARKLGYINNLCCLEDIELPKATPKRVDSFTLTESNTILKNYKKSYYGEFFVFLLCTGCRVGEGIALTWNDIDFFNKRIYIRNTDYKGALQTVKTSAGDRALPMYDIIEKMLVRLYKKRSSDCSRVFLNTFGRPINYRSLLKCWHRFLDLLNIAPVGMHVLRHTFAHMALRTNIPVKVVSAWLGHADTTITLNIYDNVTTDDMLNASSELARLFG